jgi:putative molybdopterin biosynthesis protein
MKEIRTKATDLPQFLTVSEVAELVRLKPRTIYEMVAQQRIPHRRAGRVLIFELEEILSWTQHKDD